MNTSLDNAKIEMFDMITSGGTLKTLCEYLAGVVDNPVAITLPTRTIIAKSESYDEKLVNDFVHSGYFDTDEDMARNENEFKKAFSTGRAGIFVWPYSHNKHMNCGCIFGRSFIAVIDCPLINCIPNKTQQQIFEMAAKLFVVLLKEQKLVSAKETKPVQAFLRALLSGDVNFAYQWSFYHGFLLNKISEYRVLWLKPRLAGTPEDIEIQLFNFADMQNDWWCISDNGGYVILMDASSDKGLDILNSSFSQFFFMCKSDCFSDIRAVVKNINLCRTLVSLLVSTENQYHIIDIDDFKPLIAYYYAYVNSDLDIFANKTIERIKAYDSKYKTSYIETLRVAIHYNQDIQIISEILHIHKNTVLYRMRQLKELFQIDLKNTGNLVSYYLSLFIDYHSKSFDTNQENDEK